MQYILMFRWQRCVSIVVAIKWTIIDWAVKQREKLLEHAEGDKWVAVQNKKFTTFGYGSHQVCGQGFNTWKQRQVDTK